VVGDLLRCASGNLAQDLGAAIAQITVRQLLGHFSS